MADSEQQVRGKAHTAAVAALEVVPFAMLIADGSGDVLAVNRKWMELSGLGRSNSLGHGWLNVLEPDARQRLRDEVLRVASDGSEATADHQLGADHHRRWARWWISRHELDGLPLVAIGVADVDDDYTRQANLYHLATHDSLTGLINRSHFVECLDQALRRSQRQSRHVAVVYVDLDGFKRVNDQGGHSLGDRVLFAIAARLRHAVRSADIVARIGGDEFAVLCEGLGAAEQADVVARRIAMALQESVELEGERWSVAASVGAAIDRGDADNAEDLVDRADRAMYSVKLARRAPTEDAPPADERLVPSFDRRARRASDAPLSGPGGSSRGAAAAAVGGSVAVGEAPASAVAQSAGGQGGRLGVLDPEEARRALRDLAEAAGAFTAEGRVVETRPAAPAESDPARHRLAADVVNLRESIDSIRRMLDRLLSSDTGIIDIRGQ